MKTDFFDTAEKFIAAGGDIYAKDKNGNTALKIQKSKLDHMKYGEDDEDGNHFFYFYEEGTMGCENENEIEEAEEKGKKPPECFTYADYMIENVDKIVKRIK